MGGGAAWRAHVREGEGDNGVECSGRAEGLRSQQTLVHAHVGAGSQKLLVRAGNPEELV